jgi:hypothetical protein
MPVSNDRGPIGESYEHLQSLPELRQARECFEVPPASPESIVRMVLQSAELAMINLHDLTSRASSDLRNQARGGAVVKLSWAQGFHRLLVALSLVPQYTVALFEAGRPVSAPGLKRPAPCRVFCRNPITANT